MKMDGDTVLRLLGVEGHFSQEIACRRSWWRLYGCVKLGSLTRFGFQKVFGWVEVHIRPGRKPDDFSCLGVSVFPTRANLLNKRTEASKINTTAAFECLDDLVQSEVNDLPCLRKFKVKFLCDR